MNLKYLSPLKDKIPHKTVREMRSWIIYQDDDIFVINKPVGVSVQGRDNLFAVFSLTLEKVSRAQSVLSLKFFDITKSKDLDLFTASVIFSFKLGA